jgi:hypothetical protein
MGGPCCAVLCGAVLLWMRGSRAELLPRWGIPVCGEVASAVRCGAAAVVYYSLNLTLHWAKYYV